MSDEEKGNRFREHYRNAFETIEHGMRDAFEQVFREQGPMRPFVAMPEDDEEVEDDCPSPGVFERYDGTPDTESMKDDDFVVIQVGIEAGSVELVLQAWDHHLDHDCPRSDELLDGLLELMMTTLIDRMGRD